MKLPKMPRFTLPFEGDRVGVVGLVAVSAGTYGWWGWPAAALTFGGLLLVAYAIPELVALVRGR